jgi:hypothetical protein
MPKIVNVNGVNFRPGQLEWEDAVGQMRAELPDFAAMRAGKATIGRTITTIGMVGRVGNYYVIVTEYGTNDGIYDFTIVPTRPKVKVTWAGAKTRAKR